MSEACVYMKQKNWSHTYIPIIQLQVDQCSGVDFCHQSDISTKIVSMLIILFIASFITIICCDCDDEILTTKHYYELGCKPVNNSDGNGIAK